MNIIVKTKTNAKEDKVLKIDETKYEAWVKTIPIEGRANESVKRLLAKYFKVSKSRVLLIRGTKSKLKWFEIKQ